MKPDKKPKAKYRYLKLGDAASIFSDSSSEMTIRNNQILRFSRDHVFASNSANIKAAIAAGHLLETDQDEFDESTEKVIYNGKGVPEDVFTGGKEVPKEPGKEAKKKEKLDAAKSTGAEIEDEYEEDDTEFEEEEEEEESIDEDDEEDEEITAIRKKQADGKTLSKKEKAILAEIDTRNNA